MTTIKTFASAILLFALAITSSKAQTVSVSGTANYDINTTVAVYTISVPLKLDAVKFSEFKLTGNKPFSIRNGNSSDQRFFDGVTVTAIDGPPHLQLIVHPELLDEQGTYELNVAYTITATGKSAVIPFTLTRQSAVLTAPTVMITETGCDLVSDQLLLKEASGKAGVQLTDLPVPAVPGIKSGKLITFGKTAISIPAAGQQPVPFHIDSIAFKELPLGKTTATMLIASKTLAAPLTVQFEIWNKRSKWWIVVIVLAGLLRWFFSQTFPERQTRL